jgi:hypothetical protein
MTTPPRTDPFRAPYLSNQATDHSLILHISLRTRSYIHLACFYFYKLIEERQYD